MAKLIAGDQLGKSDEKITATKKQAKSNIWSEIGMDIPRIIYSDQTSGEKEVWEAYVQIGENIQGSSFAIATLY